MTASWGMSMSVWEDNNSAPRLIASTASGPYTSMVSLPFIPSWVWACCSSRMGGGKALVGTLPQHIQNNTGVGRNTPFYKVFHLNWTRNCLAISRRCLKFNAVLSGSLAQRSRPSKGGGGLAALGLPC